MTVLKSKAVRDVDSLDHLFRPGSIAVIGASSNAAKIGGLPVAFLLANGFAGKIYPINPKAGEVQGLKAYPSIRDVPDNIDLAIVAVPAALVGQAVEDIIAAGVRGVVMFSSGFAELGKEGNAVQDALMARIREAGVRLLGPNCLGFMNPERNVFATFSPVVGKGVPAGRIGLVSQSGAYGAYAMALARERGLGLSYWITTGNEGNVDFADCLAWLAKDPGTDVILGYMEGCPDGRKLEAALTAAREAGKPVVITKVGRSEIGAQAAASHTAALAGEDAIFDAIFRQHGAYRAYSIEEFFDVGYAVSVAGQPSGGNLGVFTVSGGAGVLMADAAGDVGLELPELDAEGQAKIKTLVPFAAPRNPVDITGQITNDFTLLSTTLDIMFEHGDYDMMISFLAAAGQGPAGDLFADQLIDIQKRHPGHIFCAVSIFNQQLREKLEQSGCIVFEDPTRALRALAALAWFAKNRASAKETVVRELAEPVTLQDKTYSEAESFKQLAAAGVPVPETRLVTRAEEAAKAAAEMRSPLVAKIASEDITHKSDIGGVRLNLAGAESVAEAFDQITANARDACPDARIDGVLLSPMEKGGVECIVGVQRDPSFGPVVMLGLGGVFVEVLRDVSFRSAPVSKKMAADMISELRGRDMLKGVRGQPPADIDALSDLIVRVSEFAVAAGDSLESLDINPVLVRPEGQGVVALDALVVGRNAS